MRKHRYSSIARKYINNRRNRRASDDPSSQHKLLEEVYNESSLPWLRELDAIETLRRVWMQHYHAHEQQTRLSR
jgi:transposase